MALSRNEVLARLDSATPWEKRLVIDPNFLDLQPEGRQSGASVDFHLGNRFTVLRKGRAVAHDPVHTDAQEDIGTTELFVPMGENFYLHPGEMVLGHTLEWIRFPGDLMAYVIGRSIWGRRGLLIVTASAVQPSSSGTITLELCNVGEVAVVVKPGLALGQLFLHHVSEGGEGVRQSVFTGESRPVLGKYVTSKVERLLLGI